jgi:sulfonate transport system substrate-binding protein
MKNRRSTIAAGIAAAAATALLLTGCLSGEAAQKTTLNIDWATYNPLSLVIKDQGWLEDALAEKGVTVNWVQSAGSNKANEALRSEAIDVGSTAGSAALLARANGSEIQVIDLYSQPEWSAIVVGPDSEFTSMEQLRGKQIAATKGTDPYFFLLQALAANGLTADDVTIQNLQHADGWGALQNGSVDAWSGLDPIMAGAEVVGAKLIYRNVDFNSYGFLNATESFLKEKPELAQLVVDAYEHARAWAQEHPEETARILAEVASLDPAVAKKVIDERTNLDVDPVPGQKQLDVLRVIGPIFVESGDVASQQQVDDALATLVNDTFIKAADPASVG